MSATKSVTLAWPYTDKDEVKHKAGDTVELPRPEAARLLNAGLARLPKTSEASEEKPADKPATKAAVLAEVGNDPEKAAAALEAERAGKNRTSIISALEAIVTNNPGGD